MNSRAELMDLLDVVEQQPGWRLAETTNGWRIYPADSAMPLIHVRNNPERRGLDNLKAQLRRSGFPPMQRPKSEAQTVQGVRVTALNGGKQSGEDTPTFRLLPDQQSAPPAQIEPRNLIREARAKIQDALDALGAIDALLGEIEGERDQVQRFKELVASMLK